MVYSFERGHSMYDLTSSPYSDCPYLYTGPDCRMSYAESMGSKYDTWHIIYLIAVIGGCTFCVIKTISVLLRKRFFPLDMQNQLHVLVHFCFFTLLIRAIDPFGWRILVPAWIILLCYDIGGLCITFMGMLIIFDWLRVMTMVQDEASGNSLNPAHSSSTTTQSSSGNKIRVLSKGLIIITSICVLICSFGTSFVGPLWLWHIIKVSFLALANVSTVACFVYFGLSVYFFLRRVAHELDQMRNVDPTLVHFSNSTEKNATLAHDTSSPSSFFTCSCCRRSRPVFSSFSRSNSPINSRRNGDAATELFSSSQASSRRQSRSITPLPVSSPLPPPSSFKSYTLARSGKTTIQSSSGSHHEKSEQVLPLHSQQPFDDSSSTFLQFPFSFSFINPHKTHAEEHIVSGSPSDGGKYAMVSESENSSNFTSTVFVTDDGDSGLKSAVRTASSRLSDSSSRQSTLPTSKTVGSSTVNGTTSTHTSLYHTSSSPLRPSVDKSTENDRDLRRPSASSTSSTSSSTGTYAAYTSYSGARPAISHGCSVSTPSLISTSSTTSPTMAFSTQVTNSTSTRVPKIIIMVVIAMLLAFSIWTHTISREIKLKYTYERPAPPPSGVLSVFLASVFDVIHLGVCLFVSFFFSKVHVAKTGGEIEDEDTATSRLLSSNALSHTLAEKGIGMGTAFHASSPSTSSMTTTYDLDHNFLSTHETDPEAKKFHGSSPVDSSQNPISSFIPPQIQVNRRGTVDLGAIRQANLLHAYPAFIPVPLHSSSTSPGGDKSPEYHPSHEDTLVSSSMPSYTKHSKLLAATIGEPQNPLELEGWQALQNMQTENHGSETQKTHLLSDTVSPVFSPVFYPSSYASYAYVSTPSFDPSTRAQAQAQAQTHAHTLAQSQGQGQVNSPTQGYAQAPMQQLYLNQPLHGISSSLPTTGSMLASMTTAETLPQSPILDSLQQQQLQMYQHVQLQQFQQIQHMHQLQHYQQMQQMQQMQLQHLHQHQNQQSHPQPQSPVQTQEQSAHLPTLESFSLDNMLPSSSEHSV